MKKFFSLMFVVMFLLNCVVVGAENAPAVGFGVMSTATPTVTTAEVERVVSVTISKKGIWLKKYHTEKLKAYISPSNATNKKVTWKSINSKIASVSSAGIVKGLKKGIAYILVTTADGKKTAKCKVIVSNPYLNKTKATLYIRKVINLELIGAVKKVTWESSDSKIASVNQKGVVYTKKKGSVTITCYSDKMKFACKLIVNAHPIISKLYDFYFTKDSVDEINVNFGFTYWGEKSAKYIYITYSPLNRVGDHCTDLSGYETYTTKWIGYFDYGNSYTCDGSIGYWDFVERMKISDIVIEYSDGSKRNYYLSQTTFKGYYEDFDGELTPL